MFAFTLLVLAATQTTLSFKILEPRADCSISISSLDPEPVVVSLNTTQFLYPEPNEKSVTLSEGQTVFISCPGGTLAAGSNFPSNTVQAKCVSASRFEINGKTVYFDDITCSRNPFHTARYTGKRCESNGREVEVGFILDDNAFARQVRICFDDVARNSLYSEYNLTRSIGAHESGVSRPSFIEDNFYNLSSRVNDLYVRNGQRTTINGLLGLSSTSTKYIKDDNDFYLARGHFTAKADFVYAPQQLATFHYVNVAPQWQTFNGYNWNIVEGNVRDYADDNGLDLVVYTGTYGVATLPHEQTGRDVELYLYVDSNGNKALPVPALYWKVVHNPKTKQGVALLGVNNPYETNLNKVVICEDISSKLNWLTWKKDDITAGYSYACSVESLREKVSYLPNIEVTSLLL